MARSKAKQELKALKKTHDRVVEGLNAKLKAAQASVQPVEPVEALPPRTYQSRAVQKPVLQEKKKNVSSKNADKLAKKEKKRVEISKGGQEAMNQATMLVAALFALLVALSMFSAVASASRT